MKFSKKKKKPYQELDEKIEGYIKILKYLYKDNEKMRKHFPIYSNTFDKLERENTLIKERISTLEWVLQQLK